jgi:hypothetical protein
MRRAFRIVAGDFVSGLYVIAPITLVALFALHPERRSLFVIGGAAAAALAAVAPVPAVAYALTQSELQRNGSSLDPHVEFHHYSGMASYARRCRWPRLPRRCACPVDGSPCGSWE